MTEWTHTKDVHDGGMATSWWQLGNFRLAVRRNLEIPTSGPTSIEMLVVGPGALKYAHVRKLPLAQAARHLEAMWMHDQAGAVVRAIPGDIVGEMAYLRLAQAFVTLRSWGNANAVAVIARARPEASEATWASRIKRARYDYGYITNGEDGEPTLSPRACALLGGGDRD